MIDPSFEELERNELSMSTKLGLSLDDLEDARTFSSIGDEYWAFDKSVLWLLEHGFTIESSTITK